jgi:hypothetical protein
MTPSGGDLRLATMCLFGMINWIYTWYHHGRAVEAGRLADHMTRLFLVPGGCGVAQPGGGALREDGGAPAG